MRPFCELINDPVKPSSRRTTAAALNTALNLHKRHFTHFSSLSLSFFFFFFNPPQVRLQPSCSRLSVCWAYTHPQHTRAYLSHTLTLKLSVHVEA